MLCKHLLHNEYIKNPDIEIRIIKNGEACRLFGCYCLTFRFISDICILRINEVYKISTFDDVELSLFNIIVDTKLISYTMRYNKNKYCYEIYKKEKKTRVYEQYVNHILLCG